MKERKAFYERERERERKRERKDLVATERLRAMPFYNVDQDYFLRR